jgi:DNA polymerase III delta subunit
MIILSYGTDTDKAREKAHGVLEQLKKKRPDAELFKLDAEGFSADKLEEFLVSRGLFESKYVVFLDRVSEDKLHKETLVGKLKEMGAAENAFVVFEGKLDKATVAKFDRHSEKVYAFADDDAVPASKAKDFNVFALSDALGKRDRKTLWLLYLETVRRNIAPEEINGILFWQAKNMVLAAETRGPSEAGLNPFVYSKAKQYAGNFSPDELRDLPFKIVRLYHDSRRGIHDFEIALERFTLSV